jgi:hypothetical protein
MTTNIEMLMSAVGAAALLVVPAVADARAHHHTAHQAGRAVHAHYDFVRRAPYAYGPTVTFPDGRSAGSDPDPLIRLELRRDFGRGKSSGAGGAQ